MSNPWLFPAAALLIGGAGGFLVGKTGSSESVASTVETTVNVAGSGRASSSSNIDEARSTRNRSLEEILKTPGQSGRIQGLLAYYENIDPNQLSAEADKLQHLPMNERIMASLLLFGRWAEIDPQSALTHSDKLGMGGMFVKPTILQSWASIDPEAAAKYFAENPREFQMMGGRGGSGASTIAAEWAKNDPQAALQWAQTLTGRDRDRAMSSVVRELAGSDPQKAVTMAAAMEGEAQSEAYLAIAGPWAASDFSATEAWIRTLPTDQKDATMAEAIGSMANQDPVLASQKADAMQEGDDKDRAINRTVDAWSRQDPAAAANWAIQQGESLNDNSIRDLVRNWAVQDDAAVADFINTQTDDDFRDEAIQSYVWANRSDNPQAVLEMARTITDERQQERATIIAAQRWMQTDPGAATPYVNQLGLSERATRRILQGGNGRRNRGN